MTLRKDIWRVGIVRKPLSAVMAAASLADEVVHWLPELPTLKFDADPFGLWRSGQLHLFVETYDYWRRKGSIDVITLDAGLKILERRPALTEPWHLSYPFLIEERGETYMLPEAFHSGALTLYRAAEFPTLWEPAARIDLDYTAIDATPFFHDGLWWLFYTPAKSRLERIAALHVAYAERLTGPWHTHPRNPVRFDSGSSRPGGTPIIEDSHVVLPVQDCSRTYGGALRKLTMTALTTEKFEAEASAPIVPPRGAGAYTKGLHTLSAAGDLTLIDAKKLDRSMTALALDVGHAFGKAFPRPPR